ncbi:MAG TPA: electron transport complex subunit E [Candidatus Bathyarchaeia archaeon]|nr:electron transport complex subunit E [Candidatus Bathyarchaeia archaeon]
MGAAKEFTKGLWAENPIFRLVLGMCPTLAITTSAANGIGMGIAATFVLVGSNAFISSLRGFIPTKIRIPCYIVIIATFVTVVDLVMNAYFHSLHKALGIFIPLIVVNCIIMGRAEAFARKNGVLYSTIDGLGMGLGFTLSLVAIGAIREGLGNGTIFGAQVMGASYVPFLLMVLPPGAFMLLGAMLGGMNRIEMHLARRSGRPSAIRREHDCASCEIFRGWFGERPDETAARR